MKTRTSKQIIRHFIIEIHRSMIYWTNQLDSCPLENKRHRRMIVSAIVSNANDLVYWSSEYFK